MPTDKPADLDPADESATEDEAAALERARRRRRLDRIFGDVLPESTSDDAGPGSGTERDAEIRRDVPPHHGG
jgi:hypothetical protein